MFRLMVMMARGFWAGFFCVSFSIFCFILLLFSLSFVCFLSPLLVPIVITLKLTGEGEVFFLQERIGKGGEKFELFSMR